ncbi:MAG TPA: class IV adenylate cyclase, partial [Isosphaeraceae bacterium]
GDANRITYKGPRLGGPTKTREELEVPLGSGPEARARMARVFENLGFRPVATVRKARRAFHLTYRGRALEVGLDLAEGLGAFAEVEALAAGPDDLPSAQEAVQALALDLGLAEVEPRSYLRMVLEASRP